MSTPPGERPIRLALLVCDTLIPSVVSVAGDYDLLYSTLLHEARKSSSDDSGEFILDSYDVVNNEDYPTSVTDYDGILISGSKASAYEKHEWIDKLVAYVADVVEREPRIKIFGFCFGHQIVGRALGGECVFSGKWEVGVTTIDLTEIGQQIFGAPSLNIQQMHRDHVPLVPPTFHLLGSTAVTHNQGMVRFSSSDASWEPSAPLQFTDIHILTVQGHPEFTAPVSEAIITDRVSRGIMDVEIAEDARGRAEWRNDGVDVIGRVVWKVLGIEC